MTVKELLQKLDNGRSICTTIYAPAERFEDRYYKLGFGEYEFGDDEVLAYEFIEDSIVNYAHIIISRPVDFTTAKIVVNFVDGKEFSIDLSYVQLELVELYDYWPAHINYKTGEEWPSD